MKTVTLALALCAAALLAGACNDEDAPAPVTSVTDAGPAPVITDTPQEPEPGQE